MQLPSKLGNEWKNSDKFYIKSHVGLRKPLSFSKSDTVISKRLGINYHLEA